MPMGAPVILHDATRRDPRSFPIPQVSYMSSPVLPDDLQLDVPAVIVPDRADAPISEITERFFRALLLKVPLDRIEELHLFSPLRQGGVETGIAVIAAREVIVPPVAEAPADEALADPELPLEETPDVDAALEELAHDVEQTVPEVVEEEPRDAEAITDESDDSPYADEAVAATLVESNVDSAELEEAQPVVEPEAVVAAAPAPKIRHTVFTARYRLVQKGPERGKWEADVVAEAEAPLITVETVVRGVQRRAGEESDTTRFTAPQIARALRLDLGAA